MSNSNQLPTLYTIDDLRIYQTLSLSEEQWQLNDSGHEILAMLESQLPAKGFSADYLVNYYSANSPTQDKTVEVAYLNLVAIQTLATAKPELAAAAATSQRVLLGSFISKTLPLYHKSYDPDKGTYSDADGRINILDSLMVIQNLAEAGIYSPQSIDWLAEKPPVVPSIPITIPAPAPPSIARSLLPPMAWLLKNWCRAG